MRDILHEKDRTLTHRQRLSDLEALSSSNLSIDRFVILNSECTLQTVLIHNSIVLRLVLRPLL